MIGIGIGPTFGSRARAFNPIAAGALAGWWDFSDVATLFQLSDGTTAVTADGNPIGYAADKSGNARHVVQATSGARPTYKVGIRNGRSISRHNVSHFLKAAPWALNQPTTVFTVAVFSDLSAGALNRPIFDGDNYPNAILDLVSGPQYRIFSGGSQQGGTADTNWHCFTARFNGASSFLRVDGSVAITTSNTGTTNPAGFTIGARGNGAGGLIGDIGEVLVYAEAISSDAIAAVEAYLAAKWGF